MSYILIVEDDDFLRQACLDTLEMQNFPCIACSNISEALMVIQRKKISVVFSDVCLNDENGFDLLIHVKKTNQNINVIMMTSFGTIQEAVKAIKNGASDYLIKPFEPNVLIEKAKKFYQKNVNFDDNEKEIISEDANSIKLMALAKKVAQSDATVLITGPSGTGKEILAEVIRKNSARSEKPFVAINCAAIPENMLEAMLFGYEKGAYTGAIQSTPGKFELAQDGTILLDEISEMSLPLQAKILRVIQEREVERLGGKKSIKLNVRIIATTNKDLLSQVKKGLFREDLYYRLNVFPIYSHPLAKRKNDIIPLAKFFIKKYSNSNQNIELSSLAIKKLKEYSWPGNVREMENVIQRSLILCNGSEILEEDIPLSLEEEIMS